MATRPTVVVSGVDTARLREAAARYREPGAGGVTFTAEETAYLLEAVAIVAEMSRLGELIPGLPVAARITDETLRRE
jgi:hypothetical protein